MLGLLPLDSCLELHKAPPVFFGRKMVENLFCHIDGIIPRVSSCTFVQYLCGVQFCTVTNNTAKCIIAHGFFCLFCRSVNISLGYVTRVELLGCRIYLLYLFRNGQVAIKIDIKNICTKIYLSILER